MATETDQYQPDYAVPPGWVIEEHLAAKRMSHAEFARRCGRSTKLISEIIAGKAPVEPKTALQIEKVLGMDASIWLGIEADYRLHRTREAEAGVSKADAVWAARFPIRALKARGTIRASSSGGEKVAALLSFFGVASVPAWQARYGAANVAYRQSSSFRSDEFVLATWRRLVEVEAEGQHCTDYRKSSFRSALSEVRRLTRAPVRDALEHARTLCNDTGVVLALIKPLPKMHLSGAAWWLSPRRPVIALSARHKTDDHLWFSLFHEAAHILLHNKKKVFVDGADGDGDEVEAEANAWAADFLAPRSAWQRFASAGVFRAADIRRFAEEQGIAPGLVVGRLQHEGLLPWSSRLNSLKRRLPWTDD